MCVILHMSVITQRGWSALMWAARGGKTEVVVELVKAGANVDMQSEVCQYIDMTHDVNVQNHTSKLNLPLFVTHTVHVTNNVSQNVQFRLQTVQFGCIFFIVMPFGFKAVSFRCVAFHFMLFHVVSLMPKATARNARQRWTLASDCVREKWAGSGR